MPAAKCFIYSDIIYVKYVEEVNTKIVLQSVSGEKYM